MKTSQAHGEPNAPPPLAPRGRRESRPGGVRGDRGR